MKRIVAAVAAATVLTFAIAPLYSANAADGDGKSAKKKKKEGEAVPAGSTTMVGDLCVKPKGAGEGVVCGLIARVQGKEEILKLNAEGDTAKQLADYRTKGVRVKVTGALADGTLKVQKVEEAVRR